MEKETVTEWIGIWSEPVQNVVEAGAVRRFADAIGDPNPMFRDEGFARGTRRGRMLAPPTFAATFDYGEIRGLSVKEDGLIHGEQSFRFERPIYVGDKLYCSHRLADVSVRRGGIGKMTFLVFEQKGEGEDGLPVFTGRMTAIRNEGSK